MAILTSGDLSFEFTFKLLSEHLWVKYEFFFRFQGQLILRDEPLRRSPVGWASRSPGALMADECDGDTFLPVLKKVLRENEPDWWEPAEPDVLIAFYPEIRFPFIRERFPLLWESNEAKAEREVREKEKAAQGGRLPDDPVTIIIFVDAYNWQGCCAYQGEGPALILSPTRAALQEFYENLRAEYAAFRERERFDERVKERDKRLGLKKG